MSAAPIPKTAPFADDEIESLNRVVGPATAVQRAWLAGFLAGLDASGTPQPLPAAPAQPAEPLTILYATESGNSEKLAGDVAKSARKMGLKPSLVDMADLDVASLAGVKKLVVIAATWGEGEPPGRAVASYAALMGDGAPRLDGVEFAVLALGDTAYVEFCAIGKAIDARLEALGGKRVADRADLDLDFAAPAARWIDGALTALVPADAAASSGGQVIAVDFGAAAEPNLGPFEAEVTAHIDKWPTPHQELLTPQNLIPTLAVHAEDRNFSEVFRSIRLQTHHKIFSGSTFWWTIGGDGFPPVALFGKHMPDPYVFSAMLTGAFAKP